MVTDDLGLIKAIKRGDLAAWAKVIDLYQRPIYYFIIRVVKQHDQAADLTQAVFIKAHEKVNKLRDEAQFKSWLYKIAINQCRNHLRIFRRYTWVDVDDANLVADASVLDDVIDKETKKRLQQAVDKLPQKQRLTVIFRIYQGLSNKEIADILGCSIDTVKANYHHALNKLKGLLAREEG